MSNQTSDCCWIILATTGCSTAQHPAKKTQGSASPDGCCWVIVATTSCTTANITSGHKLENVANDCCWIIVATTSCSV